MGMDREVTDIWKFGRPRDDLTTAEVIAAPNPELTIEEYDRRQMLVDQWLECRLPSLLKGLSQLRADKPTPSWDNTPISADWNKR